MWISPILSVGYFLHKNHQNRLVEEINRCMKLLEDFEICWKKVSQIHRRRDLLKVSIPRNQVSGCPGTGTSDGYIKNSKTLLFDVSVKSMFSFFWQLWQLWRPAVPHFPRQNRLISRYEGEKCFEKADGRNAMTDRLAKELR